MPIANGRKGKKLKEKKPTRSWSEVPSDIMMNILQRVGVVDRIENAQKVCTAWREICKDPAMWRVIYMEECYHDPAARAVCKKICKHAVDRSQGQLVDLTVVRFCDYELLQYVADRSSQLRRLEIVHYFGGRYEFWSVPFKKLPLLEELSLVRTKVRVEHIEAAGRYCPLLKTLKLNQQGFLYWRVSVEYSDYVDMQNDIALAIGKNLPGLTHLELIGSAMKNEGLQAILDGCCHLESLDLRGCLDLNLYEDLEKRCYRQINYLKLPQHSLDGEYDGSSDYDDYPSSYDDDDDDDEEEEEEDEDDDSTNLEN